MVALSKDAVAFPLALICFGSPAARLLDRPSPPELRWRKHLAFLIYLALSPGRTRAREHLLGVLWPESDEQQARHSLNEAVRRLRGSLGGGRIVSEGETLTLSDSGLYVDALRFKEIAFTDPAAALAIFTGDFLEGFSRGTTAAFDDWATGMRERVRSTAAELMIHRGGQSLVGGRLAEAATLASRALAIQRYSEPAAHLLMRASALSGDGAGALAAYHKFAETLEQELNEHPSSELAALAERIRHERWRSGLSAGPDVPPLVVRSSERIAFGMLAEALRAGPRTLIIVGPPGTGRSRVVDECIQRLALEGATVAAVRPLESDHDVPWSTLRALMRSGLGHAPGLIGADPDALAVLAALIPELPHSARTREPRDWSEVGAALAASLAAAAEEAPIGLAVDDAELADGATVTALHAAVAALSSTPLALIISTRDTTDARRPELLALRGATGRGLRGLTVRLESFTPAELALLVQALATWCPDEHERHRLTRCLALQTGGDPLLAVALLRGLQQRGGFRQRARAWPPPGQPPAPPIPIRVPEPARLAIVARMSALEEEPRRSLAIASTLARVLDLDLIADLAECSRSQLEGVLPALERAGFVALEGNRYVLTASVFAQVARRELLTRGQRRALRRRAVQRLADRTDLASRVLRTELMAVADPGDAAFRDALSVAREAVTAKAVYDARRAIRAAERSRTAVITGEREALELIRTTLERMAPPGR